MAYDYRKLQGAIKEKFKNQSEFAKAIGMGESTLSLKLNNKAEWSQEEMLLALSILNKPIDDVKEYFFAH